MFADTADALVWIIRLVLLAGLGWGGWLCIGHLFLPARSEKNLHLEHFATFALLVLILTTLGGVLHAG
jgi:hypothetical protein